MSAFKKSKGFTPTPTLAPHLFTKQKNTKSKLVSGFTLVEIVIVITIMAVFSAIMYSSFDSARAQSRDQRKISDIAAIQLALETYFNKNGFYPADLSDPSFVPKYILSIPTSPNGDSYNYFPMSNGSGPCISYQLWVKLERNNSTAANSKKGFDSISQPFANGLSECGSGHLGVKASSDLLIYDVMPQ